MTLDGRTLANRRNARLGGPKTDEGKQVSRMNARRHGILSACLTDADRRHARGLLAEFRDDLRPTGPVEDALVEKLVLTHLRLQRCARAEREYHQEAWGPRVSYRLDGTPSVSHGFLREPFEKIAQLVNRYDTSLTNQFLRLLHHLERVQRIRAGGDVPPPAVAQIDVNR